MDISFYVLLTIACLVLLLAMWVCANSSTPKWGHDLTLELPPHLLQEVLFRTTGNATTKHIPVKMMVPTAPSEMACDPLLSNEHSMGMSSPPPVPAKPKRAHMLIGMDHGVQVLPACVLPNRKLKPVFYSFATEEPS